MADKKTVLQKVSKDGTELENYKEFQNDKEVVMAAVANDGRALEYADDSLKKDREIVMAAVASNGCALEFADDSLKKDKEVVMVAAINWGGALQYADDSFKKDREVVMVAVTNEGYALGYASAELRADEEIVKTAIENNKYAKEFSLLGKSKSKKGSIAKIKLYSKAEPSGEYGMGKLNDKSIQELKEIFGNNEEMLESRLCNAPYEYTNIGQTFGIFTSMNNEEFPSKYKKSDISYIVSSRIELPKDDEGNIENGVYIFFSAPSKYSFNMTLDEDSTGSNNIDIKKITMSCTYVDFNGIKDSYGDVDGCILSSMSYDGEDLESFGDGFDDKGYSHQVTIVQYIDNNARTIFCSFDTNDIDTFSWGESIKL